MFAGRVRDRPPAKFNRKLDEKLKKELSEEFEYQLKKEFDAGPLASPLGLPSPVGRHQESSNLNPR